LSEPQKSSAPPDPFDRETYRFELDAAVGVAFGSQPISEDARRLLVSFGVLLAERARLFNLTRLTAPRDMAVLHFLDSFHAARVLGPDPGTVIDIGTGPGVPGIPLAILRPEIPVTLIDGTAKKARFVAECIAALGLKNAKALHARAEEYLRKRRYGTGLLRASVKPARMMEILEAAGFPLERVVFMLGSDGDVVARTLNPLGYEPAFLEKYRLPGVRKDRFLAGFKRMRKRRRP